MIIRYEGVDITSDILDMVKRIEYTDSIGMADSLRIVLEDKDSLWKRDWQPKKGDKLEVELGDGLTTGIMYVDLHAIAGPPSTFEMGARSVPLNAKEMKSKPWENVFLSSVAEDIAAGMNFKLFFDADNPRYDRLEQSGKADLEFLFQVCCREGIGLKVFNQQIVLFDEQRLEQEETITTIDRNGSDLSGYSIEDGSEQVNYRACRLRYGDIDYTFTPPDPDTGPVLNIAGKVNGLGEAERFARKALREANKDAVHGYIELPQSTNYAAGCCVTLNNFGTADGKYFVTGVKHSRIEYNSTTLFIRKVLEGY